MQSIDWIAYYFFPWGTLRVRLVLALARVVSYHILNNNMAWDISYQLLNNLNFEGCLFVYE